MLIGRGGQNTARGPVVALDRVLSGLPSIFQISKKTQNKMTDFPIF